MRQYIVRGWILVSLLAMMLVPAAFVGAVQSADWRCVEINGNQILNVRTGPGVNYPLVTSLPAGDQLEADFSRLTAADGYNWLPVRFGNTEGWTITARLDNCPAQPVPTATPFAPSAESLDGINQDGTLDHYEIEEIARSVVLIASMRNNRIRSTGTGTIIAPDGLIITNAHVVDNADTLLVGLLEDLNDPPEYQYIAEVVSFNENMDVALIAIRTDEDGHRVDTAALNLPYIPITLDPRDVYRGDMIYIFGYPGIGDDYLVVTSGSIVSVENGDVDGERLPVWYRTDAELAPGNSGGLAVNGNGEFVGIPTVVISEDQTGGRLGVVRPTGVAMMAVESNEIASTPPTVTAPDPEPDDPLDALAVTVQAVEVRHSTVENEEAGITLDLSFTVLGWERENAVVVARVFHDDLASAPVTNPNAPQRYRDDEFNVQIAAPIQPCCAQTIYSDFALFLPYTALGLDQPGSYPLKILIELTASDGSWRRPISWEFITYTRS